MANDKLKPNEKLCLTVCEAARYSSIGENKLRKIIDDNQALAWVLHVGSQVRIKREAFEKWVSDVSFI